MSAKDLLNFLISWHTSSSEKGAGLFNRFNILLFGLWYLCVVLFFFLKEGYLGVEQIYTPKPFLSVGETRPFLWFLPQFLAFYTVHIERAIVPLWEEREKEVQIKELMDKAKNQSKNSCCIIHARITIIKFIVKL